MRMLPRIACLKSERSGLARWILLVCGFAVLGLPTWSPEAHSQSSVPSKFENAPGERPVTAKMLVAGTDRPALRTAAPLVEFFPELTSGEKRIQAALEEEIQFNFVDESLEGVAKYLTDKHGLAVVMDLQKLADADIAPESNDITLKISGISLGAGLKRLLKSKKMTFVIADEEIKLVALADALPFPITRFYPARDLVGNSEVDDKMLLGILQSSTFDHSAGIFWIDQDGEGGEISILPAMGCLVIRATSEAHEKVLKVLQAVRRAKSGS